MMSDDGFLSRWSRRKRGEEAEPAAPAPEPVAAAAPAPGFDVTTLPDIATLSAESDFTAFLQKGVPEFLKRQALRRAWMLDPGIRDFCGPADYAWDFNAVDGVPGFSLTLGGDVKKLLAQAIGQLDVLAKPEAETPDFLPPDVVMALSPEPLEIEPPTTPLRLADAAAPDPVIEAEEIAAKPLPSPRHGSAMPALADNT